MCLQNIKQQQTTKHCQKVWLCHCQVAPKVFAPQFGFSRPIWLFLSGFVHFPSILFALLNFYFQFNFESWSRLRLQLRLGLLFAFADCRFANSLSSLIRHVRPFETEGETWENVKLLAESFICVNKAKINWNLLVAVVVSCCQPIINLTVSGFWVFPLFFCLLLLLSSCTFVQFGDTYGKMLMRMLVSLYWHFSTPYWHLKLLLDNKSHCHMPAWCA